MFQSEITQAVAFGVHLGERRGAVVGVVDVGEAELLQQIADNPDHGVVVVDHKHGH
jgi:hypothetical protein